jgi:hypothetical protein
MLSLSCQLTLIQILGILSNSVFPSQLDDCYDKNTGDGY